MQLTSVPLNVAIQGFPGAFHDMAARKYFGSQSLEVKPCITFRDAFEQVRSSAADVAVVAIENSLGGSLLPNYSLLKNSRLQVVGEVFLRIEQHLMALPGQRLEDIQEVQSHPMAIIQCEQFLDPLRGKGVKIVDTADTALSAMHIAQNKLNGVATLASALAAEMYGLEIIQKNVETNKRNFTRFMVLAKEGSSIFAHNENKVCNKASICFTLPHKVGSLSQILSVLAFYNVNLTKIQSAPIIGKEWEYFFYVDILFQDTLMYQKALEAIQPLLEQLDVLGEYVAGELY